MKILWAGMTALILTACGPAVDRSAAASRSNFAASQGLADLSGRWTVVRVRVTPSDVQALSENDPSDMGAVLNITADRLAWKPRTEGTFSDVCNGPQLETSGVVSCREGQFGPAGSHLKESNDRIQLDWYDGGILELVRAPH